MKINVKIILTTNPSDVPIQPKKFLAPIRPSFNRLHYDIYAGHGSLGHGSLGHGSLGHGSLGHGSLGHGSLGHGSLGHGGMGHGAKA